MKRTQKRKNLIYLPGFLSLLFFLPVGFFILDSIGAFKQYGVIEVNAMPLRIAKKVLTDPSSFDFGLAQHKNLGRVYKTYVLTGEEKRDIQTLKVAQTEIRKLKGQNNGTSENTQFGIHFHFSEKSEYWAFVAALEILYKEEVHYFTPIGNEIWVFDIPQVSFEDLMAKSPKYINCGNSYSRLISNEENTSKGGADFKLILEYWLPLSLLILIMFLNFSRSNKLNLNN
ncbi:hypothetical protein [Rufibacter sp. LB8]|uniref:hypothetical protein n=1 Tax=Rufibacter sp. LB8 TaxID=2777781 RepID=UPI00178C4B05|nr:hypothetical protein [Rufibacter sp. LB8]